MGPGGHRESGHRTGEGMIWGGGAQNENVRRKQENQENYSLSGGRKGEQQMKAECREKEGGGETARGKKLKCSHELSPVTTVD